MKGISFKQYLILRKLYKSQPKKIQLDINSKDFKFLLDNEYIESGQDSVTPKDQTFVAFFYIDNGLSTITNEGSSTYHSYFDKYLNRTGIITSFILSVIAIIISIAALYKSQ